MKKAANLSRNLVRRAGSMSSLTPTTAMPQTPFPNYWPPTSQPAVKLPAVAGLSDSSSTPEDSSMNKNRTRMHYVTRPPDFPKKMPWGYGVSTAPIPAMESEPRFDPAVHLQIEPPEAILSADFIEWQFPLPGHVQARGDFSLGYSKPFRLLSDAGVDALDALIKANECYAKSTERITKCIRGLGYRSQFVRDFNRDPQLVDLLSAMAGKPLAPHGMNMNMSQVNMGRPVAKGEKPAVIDQWHLDSVDYVLIIIMSDNSQTVGGDLQVLHKNGIRDNPDFIANGVDDEFEHLVKTIQFPGKGHAIFAQGSQVLHRITPVLQAIEPRVSVVNSYMSRNVFDVDSTRYYTFKTDPDHISKVDFARHTAWRVEGMMNYIEREMAWGTPKDQLAHLMRTASETLEKAARIVNEEESDKLDWIKDDGIEDQFMQAKALQKRL